MHQLSGMDASFLYLETPNVPMHVGAISILEGTLQFDDFRDLIEDRIHLVDILRQRLVEVPLGLDRPYWVNDPDFNIDLHLQHIALPHPGDWRSLRAIASRFFSLPLDRSRALWEMMFVEGLEKIPQVPPGSTAIISKVHHAAIDGMSGAALLGLLFDISPEGRDMEPPPPFTPDPIPTDLELIAKSGSHLAQRGKKLPGLLFEAAKAAAKARTVGRGMEPGDRPAMPFSAPKTLLNATVSSSRVWNTALLSLDRVKALKRVIEGTTVNDVMLAICSGALRRYLLEKDDLPDEPLVALVPISVRSQNEKDAMGNQVSGMFVQLATDVDDPVERLNKLHRNAQAGKMYQDAIDAKRLTELTEFVPFGLAGQAARAYSRSNLADLHRPVFNVTITNVPGPQIPLYLAGTRLLAHMGTAPIIDSMGLTIAIFSYDGVLSVSATSSDNIMPDIDRFARYLREEANTLEAAVLALKKDEPETERDASTTSVTSIFEAMQARLKKEPEMKLRSDEVFQFQITGEQSQSWVFDLESEPRHIYAGESDDAVCTVSMQADHFLKMASGQLDGMAAFMQGKLKVAGDVNKAIAFGKVLATFQ